MERRFKTGDWRARLGPSSPSPMLSVPPIRQPGSSKAGSALNRKKPLLLTALAAPLLPPPPRPPPLQPPSSNHTWSRVAASTHHLGVRRRGRLLLALQRLEPGIDVGINKVQDL